MISGQHFPDYVHISEYITVINVHFLHSALSDKYVIF